MVVGRSSVSMNLFQKQEIACLGCQMTTFNLSPLSMNLSVLVSISRLLLCQSKAVLARKSQKSVFFPLIAQNAEENLEGNGIILHEWRCAHSKGLIYSRATKNNSRTTKASSSGKEIACEVKDVAADRWR